MPTVQMGARLSEQLADALATEIRQGRLATGERLPTEAALVERFKVSRSVVREALSRLKSLGLIDSRQGSGVFVREIMPFEPLHFDPKHARSLQAVTQMVELRRALESEAAELAAERRSDADVKRMRAALAALEKSVRDGSDGVAQDVAFHLSIARASGNPFIQATLEYLGQYLRGATQVTRANEARRADYAEQVQREHGAIVEAIAAGEPARARKAAAAHMHNAIRRIKTADASFWTEQGSALASTLVESTRR